MRRFATAILCAAATTLAVLVPTAASAAPSWQTPEPISTLIGSIALDGTGTAAVGTGDYPWTYTFRPLGGPLGSSTDFGAGLNNGPYGPSIVSNAAGDMFAFNSYYPWVGYRAPGGSSFAIAQTKDSSNHSYTPIDIAVNPSGAAVGLFAGGGATTYVGFRPAGAATSFDLTNKIDCCPEATAGAGTEPKQINYDTDGGVSVVYASPPGSFQLFQNYAPPGGSFGTPTQIPVGDSSDVCCVFAHGSDGTAGVGWVRVSTGTSSGDGIMVATRAPGGTFGAPQVVASASGDDGDYVNDLELAAGTDGGVAAGWLRRYADTTNCESTSGGNYGYEVADKAPGGSNFGTLATGAHTWPSRSHIDALAMSGHQVLTITDTDNATTGDMCVNNSANEIRDLTATITPIGPGAGPGSSAVVATTLSDSGGNYYWPQLGSVGFGPGGQILLNYGQYDGTSQHRYLRAYEDSSGGPGGGGAGPGPGGGGGGGAGGGGGGGAQPTITPPGSLVLSGPIRLTTPKYVPLSFRCGDVICQVVAQALGHSSGGAKSSKKSKKRPKLVVLAKFKGKVPADKRKTLRLKVTKAGKAALKGHSKLKITITIDVHAGARHQSIKRSATLVVKHKKKKS